MALCSTRCAGPCPTRTRSPWQASTRRCSPTPPTDTNPAATPRPSPTSPMSHTWTPMRAITTWQTPASCCTATSLSCPSSSSSQASSTRSVKADARPVLQTPWNFRHPSYVSTCIRRCRRAPTTPASRKDSSSERSATARASWPARFCATPSWAATRPRSSARFSNRTWAATWTASCTTACCSLMWSSSCAAHAPGRQTSSPSC